MTEYFQLIGWWLLFFAAHSILASTQVKAAIDQHFQALKPYYRLLYNLIALLLLVPAILTYHQMPQVFLFSSGTIIMLMGSMLAVTGSYILIAGFKNYRADEFIGTYQLKNKHDFHPTQLNRNGWNAVVRHPLYFGGILLAVGLFIIFPTIKLGITAAMTLMYLYIGTLWEEKKLVAEFGDTYKIYKQEVSMLLPVKWLMGKLSGKA